MEYQITSDFVFRPNTIVIGDCIREMSKIPSGSVDLVLTDPPFGIDFASPISAYRADIDYGSKGYCEIDSSCYRDFARSWILQLPRLMKDTASGYIIIGWQNLFYVEEAIRDAGLHIQNHLIWKYQFGVGGCKKRYTTSHYHILFFTKSNKQWTFNKKGYMEDVIIINRKFGNGDVKVAPKLPLELVSYLVEVSSNDGDLVFDPFMGNGTTAEACIILGRHFFGFEKNPNAESAIRSFLDNAIIRASHDLLSYLF